MYSVVCLQLAMYEVFLWGLVHIYTAFWIIFVTRGLNIGSSRDWLKTTHPPLVNCFYRWRISFPDERFDYVHFNETFKSFISPFASNIDGLRLGRKFSDASHGCSTHTEDMNAYSIIREQQKCNDVVQTFQILFHKYCQ